MKIIYAGNEGYGHFALCINRTDALILGIFDRSRTKIKALSQGINHQNGSFYWHKGYRRKLYTVEGWHGILSSVRMGRDAFNYSLCYSTAIGSRYLITTGADMLSDMYQCLMEKFRLPLKNEWTEVILGELLSERLIQECQTTVYQEDDVSIVLHNKNVSLNDILVYSFSSELVEEKFEEIVSALLRERRIFISEKFIPSLELNGRENSLDMYLSKYGSSLVDNLQRTITPLTDLKSHVDTLALKERSLFPQQAASVNGVLALMEKGVNYAVLNMGMGVGKTLMAASVCEAASVRKWLRSHPGATLKDAYQEGAVNYRALIMCPGHLKEKWKEEILSEIPYAKVTVVNQLSQLVELRAKGREPHGKEFFVMSKDFSKLGTPVAPIPNRVKKKAVALSVCSACRNTEDRIVPKIWSKGRAVCPVCEGSAFEPFAYTHLGTFKGLVCPECGELLMRFGTVDLEGENEPPVLGPKDFASKTTANSRCYHCGAELWGGVARPLGGTKRPSKWYKVSHFANARKQSKKTAFVLSGYEAEYKSTCITTDGWTVCRQEGVRRYPPALFIKKYLKGYFSFQVFDEAHMLLGDSAQSVAAHHVSKAGGFNLLLTGTISNGTAEAFWNMFWMFEPSRMRSSWSYGDKMRFCHEYGCTETVYEAGDAQGAYNKQSRGRIVSPARVRPGISPVLFGKLLIDRCLYLDIDDLSGYLPKLKETVEVIDAPIEVMAAYKRTIEELKDSSKSGAGMSALSAMLNFGLSYLDKPFGVGNIMSPYKEDLVLGRVENFDYYAENMLPKEQRLIEIIRQELSEGRYCFVYCQFTGKAETNITGRLKALIEQHCFLKGSVEIIDSSISADRRELWFHERASEGVKVFITNPKNVETGLDFCFKHNGVNYNYPTLIFYQTGYSLATIWQASRRHYRLSQKEECRTFYLAYSESLQTAALAIMAKKQAATAAIQGKFSSDGLANMARGIDMRAQLAAALASGDMSDRESLSSMFDVLDNSHSETAEAFVPAPSFYEVIGVAKNAATDFFGDEFGEEEADFSELFAGLFAGLFAEAPETAPETLPELFYQEVKPGKKTKSRNRNKEVPSLFDLVS